MQETFSSAAPPAITKRTSLRYLKGVGPERYKLLTKLDLFTLEDLFYFFPRRYESRKPIKNVEELNLEDKQCVQGIIQSRSLIRTRYGQSIFKLVLSDGKKSLFASWFNQPYLSRVFAPKTPVVLYGKPEKSGSHLQMIHPEYEIIAEGRSLDSLIHSGRIAPIYSLTEDLNQKSVRQMMFSIIKTAKLYARDYLAADFKTRLRLPALSWALEQIHFPESFENLKEAYRRLAFDEFFMMQIVIQMKKARLRKTRKDVVHRDKEGRVKEFLDSIGFELTRGQKEAIADILKDMKKNFPMNRLVQGDVGSGKTIVAAASLLFTVENGFQGALMAPTEVLAQQHFVSLSELLEPMGISCALLVQNLSEEDKKKTLEDIREGRVQIVIGTHALIQEGVQFKKLGLVVIDEQHKFGVFQRNTLREKGGLAAHFLLMTATPIPRTLSMTLYGDLDISVIAELPKGRKPVKTLWVNDLKRQAIYDLVEKELEKGRQTYVLCPLIDKTDTSKPSMKKTEIKDVLTHHQALARTFAHRKIALLHGQMNSSEKTKIIQAFKDQKIDVLVSTVVIEVGVNVPNATMMIIENAERFGLSQLHQLRGRVGRGEEESYCVLFSESRSAETMERLSAFEKMTSGFDIAEKDLEIRGSGDIVGEKQHGLPELRIGDLIKDIKIMEGARQEAKKLIESDPNLSSVKNLPIKRAIKDRFKIIDSELIAFTG